MSLISKKGRYSAFGIGFSWVQNSTDIRAHKGRILDQRWEVDTKLFSPKMVLRFLLILWSVENTSELGCGSSALKVLFCKDGEKPGLHMKARASAQGLLAISSARCYLHLTLYNRWPLFNWPGIPRNFRVLRSNNCSCTRHPAPTTNRRTLTVHLEAVYLWSDVWIR